MCLDAEGAVYFSEKCTETDDEGVARFLLLEKTAGEKVYEVEISSQSFSEEVRVNVLKIPWVVGIYMGGDNNLVSYTNGDLQEVSAVSRYSAPVIFLDQPLHDSRFIFYEEDGEYHYVSWDDNANSGATNTLYEVIKELFSIDAEHYALILWDHGSGWLHDAQYMEKSLNQLKSVVFDDSATDALSTAEIRETLERAVDEIGKTFSVIGMDACYMSQMGILYELKDLADYIIASIFTEPGDGWNYEFLSEISNTTTAEEFSRYVVDYYLEYYTDYDGDLSLIVTDAGKIGKLADALSELGQVLSENFTSDLKSSITEFMNNSIHAGTGEYKNFVDMKSFFSQLTYYNVQTVRIYSQNVLDVLSEAVVYGYFLNGGSSIDISGIGIFFPESVENYNEYLPDMQTLLFYTEEITSGWWNFLRLYVESL